MLIHIYVPSEFGVAFCSGGMFGSFIPTCFVSFSTKMRKGRQAALCFPVGEGRR